MSPDSSIQSIRQLIFASFAMLMMGMTPRRLIFIGRKYRKTPFMPSVMTSFSSLLHLLFISILNKLDSFVNLFISKSERDRINYLNIEDFLRGGHMTIFHRRFFLYDCDECTKTYLREKFGRSPYPLLDVDAERECKATLRLPPIPPHGMFGRPEDTIQNVKSLVPKARPKDRMKLEENQNRVLRYRATMVTTSHRDERGRRPLV